MNRVKLHKKLLLTVLVATTFVACNEVNKGYLVLERPENKGVINIRESKIDIDSNKSRTVLVGGEKKTLKLSVGKHSIVVHSKDPFNPSSTEYSWQSKPQKIEIIKQETTRVVISPDTTANEYCCGWLITN